MFWKKKAAKDSTSVWHTCVKCPKFKTSSMNAYYYHSDLYHGTSYLPKNQLGQNKYVVLLQKDLLTKFPSLRAVSDKDVRISSRKLEEEHTQKVISKLESKLSGFIIKPANPILPSTSSTDKKGHDQPPVIFDDELISKLEEQVNNVLINLELLEKCMLEASQVSPVGGSIKNEKTSTDLIA